MAYFKNVQGNHFSDTKRIAYKTVLSERKNRILTIHLTYTFNVYDTFTGITVVEGFVKNKWLGGDRISLLSLLYGMRRKEATRIIEILDIAY